MIFLRNLFLIGLISVFFITCSHQPAADLVLLNGKIATVDSDFSICEAVAVRDGRFVCVGSDEEVSRFIGEKTHVVDLKDRLVLPGLIDAHGHLYSLGQKLSSLDISGARSFDEVVSIVAERVRTAKPGEWITGGRWDHTRWPGKTFPVHDALSRISPENPVFLNRVDGNAAFVNARALEQAGIGPDTPDPEGGKIMRKPDGSPTGVLVNRAMNLVKAHLPRESDEAYRHKVIRALDAFLAAGLTGVHEAGISPHEIELYKQLVDQGAIHVRVNAMLGTQEEPVLDVPDLAGYFRSNRVEKYGEYALQVRTIKLFFDGALGSRGAAFFDPYVDDPENTGLFRISPDYITKVSEAALAADMSVATHCIGTRGNRLCLDAYIRAFRNNPKKDHRFRIEHAQIVRQEDVPLFSEWSVIPSMQPTHCTSDMDFIADRIGEERTRGGYAWRRFLDDGRVIPCGSDFPVESCNPLLGIYAAVTRQDLDGHPAGGWHPAQKMTIEEAIRGFTIWAAYAGFQEDVLGSIEPGKLADMTVLDRDILTIDPSEIPNVHVLATIIGGAVRYGEL